MNDRRIAWQKWHGLSQDDFPANENSEIVKLIKEEAEAMESLSSDFWILNTNFDINDDVLRIVLKTEGVERFQPLTRYKAFVGFPKSGFFKPRDVMNSIQNALCLSNISSKEDNISDILDLSLLNKINSVEKEISEYKYWKMWIIPNGSIEAICSNETSNEYSKQEELLEDGIRLVGGMIKSSEDVKYVS